MITSVLHPSTQGFQRATAAYERGRPNYPKALGDFLVNELAIKPTQTTVEVGAGTGKFTRLIAPLSKVIAVEPITNMRAHLRSISRVKVIAAAAEKLELPSRCADFVMAAQAFHWFATPKALLEFHRVLKPGGKLVLIWNVRDPAAEWNQQLDVLLNAHQGHTPRFSSYAWKDAFSSVDCFSKLEKKIIPHTQTATAKTMVDRIGSVSFIASLPVVEQSPVLKAVSDLFSKFGDQEFSVPYQTHVYWSQAL